MIFFGIELGLPIEGKGLNDPGFQLQRRLALLEGIARGERAIAEGRTLSQAEVKRRMRRWLK
jgi:predicted transcriptional regulator